MFFLDLAVPRDIAPDVREVYNVFSYSIDDLEEVANENRARRAREIPVAEKIVEEELENYLAWLGSLSVVPTVTQIDVRRVGFDAATMTDAMQAFKIVTAIASGAIEGVYG